MSGFNVSAFRAEGLQFGGARPTQFHVILDAPADLGRAILPRAQFLVQAATLPPSQISEIQVPYFGRTIKMAGDRSFPDWTVSIMNDEDFALRAMFEAWSNKINTHVSNRLSVDVAPLDYKREMQVIQYTKDGNVARSYNFVGAFPTVISPIGVSWAATNQYESFDVTFSYDWWEPLEQVSASHTKLYDKYDVQLAGDGIASRETF